MDQAIPILLMTLTVSTVAENEQMIVNQVLQQLQNLQFLVAFLSFLDLLLRRS